MSRQDFDTDAQYREQLFKELIEIVHELGWVVSIPSGAAQEEVPYMIIGKDKPVSKVMEAIRAQNANRTKTRS